MRGSGYNGVGIWLVGQEPPDSNFGYNSREKKSHSGFQDLSLADLTVHNGASREIQRLTCKINARSLALSACVLSIKHRSR
jgi:hypothetical protein